MPKLLSNRFLVDESVEYRIVLFLRDSGFDVVSISEESPSIVDPMVLYRGYMEQRILITNDVGFGVLVFKEKQKSHGVVLIRLPRAPIDEKVLKLKHIITFKKKNLARFFTVITETRMRFKSLP